MPPPQPGNGLAGGSGPVPRRPETVEAHPDLDISAEGDGAVAVRYGTGTDAVPRGPEELLTHWDHEYSHLRGALVQAGTSAPAHPRLRSKPAVCTPTAAALLASALKPAAQAAVLTRPEINSSRIPYSTDPAPLPQPGTVGAAFVTPPAAI